MARPHGNPDDLILRLEAALAIARPSDVVGANEMAGIVKMTWRNLLMTHIEPDSKFPIQRRGAEGLAWEFHVIKVLKHMLRRARQRKRANEAKSRRLMELTSFSVPEGSEAMSIAEVSKLYDVNVKADALKREQKKQIPNDIMRTFIIRYNQTVSSGIMNAPQHLDPSGSLSPEMLEEFKEYLRVLAISVHKLACDFVEKWRATDEPGGIA